MKSVKEKIENKITKKGSCWVWNGEKFRSGYGRIRIHWKKYTLHRVVFELYIGPIPKGLCVLHKCDNKPCINPEHLFLGTKADNAHDRDRKGRTILHLENLIPKTSKITRAQVIKIKNDNRKQKEIGADYGLSQQQISRIKNDQTRRHI